MYYKRKEFVTYVVPGWPTNLVDLSSSLITNYPAKWVPT